MNLRTLAICTLLMAMSLSAAAQKKIKDDTYVPQFAISWNAAELVESGLISLGATVPLARHLSANLDLKCYPWTKKDYGQTEYQNFNTVIQPGLRYWFWHVNSGLWINSAFKWKATRYRLMGEEAFTTRNAYGLVETIGYSLMIGRHLNINAGIGGGIGMRQEPSTVSSWREIPIDKKGKLFLEYAEPVVGISIIF